MSLPELAAGASYAEILAVYQEVLDYDTVGSLERARLAVRAGRLLLSTPVRRTAAQGRGEEVELVPEILERQVSAAISWLAARVAATTPPRELGIDPCWREL